MAADEHLNTDLFDFEHLEANPELFDRDSYSYYPDDTVSPDDARYAQQLATFGELAISMPARQASRVADTGDIRTQFETHRSEGALAYGLREDVEEAMGYSDAPVYGYFRRSPDERPPYGDVDFRLRSDVKARTTIYPDDSLNTFNLPGSGGFEVEDRLPQPASQVAATSAEDVRQDRAAPPMPPPGRSYADVPYVEGHIFPDYGRKETVGYAQDEHGERTGRVAARVPLSDVHRAVIHEPGGVRPQVQEIRLEGRRGRYELGRKLSQAGVAVDHEVVDLVEQPPLPMTHDDGFAPPTTLRDTRRRRVRHADLGDRWGE